MVLGLAVPSGQKGYLTSIEVRSKTYSVLRIDCKIDGATRWIEGSEVHTVTVDEDIMASGKTKNMYKVGPRFFVN